MSLKAQLIAIAERIEHEAKISLNTSVAQQVVDIGKKNVQSIVYDAYPNPAYERTFQLRDTAWDLQPIENGVLIGSNRTERGSDISYIVESGLGYTIPDTNVPLKYGFPRPFMKATKDQVLNSSIVSDTLAIDLAKNLGVKVRKSR